MLIYAVLYTLFNVKGKIVRFRALNACGKCISTALLVVNLGIEGEQWIQALAALSH